MSLFHPARLRARIVDDWRLGWRFWSIRLQAAAIATGAVLAAAPGFAGAIWSTIPADVRAMIPGTIGRWLPVAFGVLAMLARFVKQTRPPAGGKEHG